MTEKGIKRTPIVIASAEGPRAPWGGLPGKSRDKAIEKTNKALLEMRTRSMKERTPPTETVRHAFAKAHPFPYTTDIEERYAEFDRWLEQVKAEAWDEGNAAGWTEATAHHENAATYPKLTITNPYKQETNK